MAEVELSAKKAERMSSVPEFETGSLRPAPVGKHALDVCLTIFMLPVAAGLVSAGALLILLADPSRKVWFVQERIGQGGRSFLCWKLRTMRNGSGEDADRHLPVGLMLRRLHIDELPQLFNVLRNEMSLVGPRPHNLSDHIRFSKADKRYNLRHAVKPGITGLAQINGFYGHIDKPEDLTGRIDHDLSYISSMSVTMDLRILVGTIFLPFQRKR